MPEKTDDKPLAVAGDDSGLDMGEDNDELKENSAPELSSDKKTDELLGRKYCVNIFSHP